MWSMNWNTVQSCHQMQTDVILHNHSSIDGWAIDIDTTGGVCITKKNNIIMGYLVFCVISWRHFNHNNDWSGRQDISIAGIV